MKKQLSASSSQSASASRFLVALGMTAVLAIALGGSIAAQDKPIALKGGKLLTITHGVIETGIVVMQGGKITAVGDANSVNIPAGAQIVDATGMTVYPGLIDSETHLGLT